MNIYLVRMEHPDGPEWDQFVREHVMYLHKLIEEKKLIASGPIKGSTLRAGFLIFMAEDVDEVNEMIKGDPFTREGLIVKLDIEQWDPLFGRLADLSSGPVA